MTDHAEAQSAANVQEANARAAREQAVADFFMALTKLAETAERLVAAEVSSPSGPGR